MLWIIIELILINHIEIEIRDYPIAQRSCLILWECSRTVWDNGRFPGIKYSLNSLLTQTTPKFCDTSLRWFLPPQSFPRTGKLGKNPRKLLFIPCTIQPREPQVLLLQNSFLGISEIPSGIIPNPPELCFAAALGASRTGKHQHFLPWLLPGDIFKLKLLLEKASSSLNLNLKPFKL